MASAIPEQRAPLGRLHSAYWLLLTTLLGLPLISPLLRWSAVPCTHDGHLHYHRIAALRHAWENGVYFSRWMPDLAFGYGYPFFVFREAPPLYLPFIPHLLGMPLPAASNLFYALNILAAGAFMFLWVRDLFDERAALVSAVAYMAAPYVLIDALVRGNAPESLALPLFPLILWAGRRWVLYRGAGSFLGGVLGLALLSLSHNISTLIFAPTLAVYLLALAILADRGRPMADDDSHFQASITGRRLARVGLLLVFGLGLAFFYTGGAVLEMNQVTLDLSTTTRNNDWRFNFASVAEILAPVAAEDPSLVNPPLLFRLGWAPGGLALLGLSGLWWIRGKDGRAREQRLHIWLMLAGMLVYLFMALPLSRALWDALPLIDFVQFPWRFVGRAALPVAFLAGVPFAWFEYRPSAIAARWAPTVLTAAAVTLLIVETLPNLYPRYCPEEPFPTILTVHEYEHLTGLVGVDPEGSYFPRTVAERPTASPLEADYQIAGRSIRRFDETALPSGTSVDTVDYRPLGVSLTLKTPTPFTARYLSFAFPGWAASIDGDAVPITPEDPSGLITFEVPAGTHEIRVEWGPTPLRRALMASSILSAIGVMAVVVVVRRRQPAAAVGPTEGNLRALGPLLLVAVLVLGLKMLSDRLATPLRQDSRPSVATAIALEGGELRLDGFNLSQAEVPAGETFDVDMAWTALAPPPVDYQTEIWLVGPDGLAWSEKGTERPRIYEDAPPTRLWRAGEWGWDSREVRVLTGTPPGDYDIVMTLFDQTTLQPVSLSDGQTGAVLGPTAILGTVTVTDPESPPPLNAQFPLEAGLTSSALRLLGYNQDRVSAAPGESVLQTFFFSCADPPDCDQVRLQLRTDRGETAVEWNLPAIRDGLPADAWPVGGFLRGQHLLRLPADLASGIYHFVLNDELELGALNITAPERDFAKPPVRLSIEEPFMTPAGVRLATLVGLAEAQDSPCFPSPSPGESCSLPLVWRAAAETSIGYHVFVHLVDRTGALVAQADGVPAAWTRPTTGWLPGEYITDLHTLHIPDQLPAGPLALRVGLYDPDTGVRLATPVGDFITVPLTSAD